MIIPDKVYNILKYVCLVALPAITALWVGLGKIWGFPYVAEIAGTLSLIDAFMGTMLGISTHNYNKKIGEK